MTIKANDPTEGRTPVCFYCREELIAGEGGTNVRHRQSGIAYGYCRQAMVAKKGDADGIAGNEDERGRQAKG